MGHARHIRTGTPRLLTKPTRTTRARLVCAVLLAFALRAFIPLGFMPASDGTFSLVICHAGLPAGLLAGQDMGRNMGGDMAMAGGMEMPQHPDTGHGHGQGQGSMDEGYCAFTTGFSSAPPPLLLAASAARSASPGPAGGHPRKSDAGPVGPRKCSS